MFTEGLRKNWKLPLMLLVWSGRAGATCSAVEARCWSESQLLDWLYLLLGRNQFQYELCNLELKDIRYIQGIIFPLQITGLSFKRYNITDRACFFFFFFSFWKLPYWCSQNRDLEMRIMACTSDKQIHVLYKEAEELCQTTNLYLFSKLLSV